MHYSTTIYRGRTICQVFRVQWWAMPGQVQVAFMKSEAGGETARHQQNRLKVTRGKCVVTVHVQSWNSGQWVWCKVGHGIWTVTWCVLGWAMTWKKGDGFCKRWWHASIQQALTVHLLYAKSKAKQKSSKLEKITWNLQKICVRE